MKLSPTTPEPNRALQVLAGGLKAAAAVVLFWIGLHSFLIGLAYSAQTGSWLPRFTGVVAVLLAIWVLIRAVGQTLRGLRPKLYEKEETP